VLYDNSGVVGNLGLSALIDTLGTASQGQVLYRGASGWSLLAPGSAGQFLQSGGAGANPAWAAAAGGGTVTSAAIVAGTNVTLSGTCSSTSSINCTINASGGSGSPGGSSGQLQYNNAGAFGGVTLGSGLSFSSGTLSATGGGGGGVPTSIASGKWFALSPPIVPGNGSALTASTLYCYFGYTGATGPTIKALGADLATVSPGNSVQFGIYSVASGTLTLVDSTASVSTTTGGGISGTVNNTTDTLAANAEYALCTNANASVAVFESVGITLTASGAMNGATALTSVTSSTTMNGSTIAQTFGTWPSTISLSSMTDSTTRNIPIIGLQEN
jgi:hypothetical protein